MRQQRPLGYVTREQGLAVNLAKGGVAFGLFLCFPGVVLTALGHSGFGDGAFEDDFSVMRIIGPILLAIGLTMLVCGICAGISHKYQQNRSDGGQQGFGTTLRTNQTSGIPIVTGTAHPGVVEPSYTQGSDIYNVPVGQQQAHPGATYPGGGYQSRFPVAGGQLPQGHQAPSQSYTRPPAASTHTQPPAPVYPPSNMSAEPPSYESAVNK